MLVETDHPKAPGLLTAVVWEAWEEGYLSRPTPGRPL
jgi:hypothetical protein